MKPFVLIATRPEDDVAQREYESVLRFSGLSEQDLIWARLDRDPFPALDGQDISGILVAGSPFTYSDPPAQKSAAQVRAEAEIFRVLDMVFAEDVPFLGACYGVGTLGTHQGARVDRTFGESIGAVTVRLTPEGAADPLLREAHLPDTFTALVGHKEAVHTLPAHGVSLVAGEASPVQMFRVGPRQYATQFHPELNVPLFLERARHYREHGYFDPEQMEEIFERIGRERADDPPRLLRAFVTLFSR